MARPKSALRKALEEKAAAHAAAAEAAAAAAAAGSTTSASNSEWEQTPTPAATPDTSNTSVSTPATTYSTPSSTLPNKPKSPIASELERLSLPGITACNTRDWTFSSPAAREAKAHVAPDFEALWDGYPRPLTFEENIAGTRELMEKDPNYFMEVVGVSSEVDEERGEGSVWLEIAVRWTDVEMRGFSELLWRRDEVGKWWCFRHTGMRTTEEHSGFV
ncbi:hypothetical protein M409DRAFT_25435 [Zasmidium cellare ATCC 36951]|uniref:Uncharacterized protein n=1 Tax=Zasmidium cellare ATCC 36951 TaxID=1080233 RepID=A0A6A6CD32_ZASCE|nr:uncharacterized protein M409DRAFT_25435 [Zasmidium cellare ATCC 36951]KAF2164088.1 hypothetical protein M409DRAFT_25435 [Zasmidium cellare ATCC 36951]